VIFLLWY